MTLDKQILTDYLPIKTTAKMKRDLEEMASLRGYGGASTLARHLIDTGLQAMQAEERAKLAAQPVPDPEPVSA